MDDSERDALLARLDERTKTILERLEKGDACMDDHEKRLGKLESFQAQLVAIAAAISFVATLTWEKIGTIIGGH